MYNTLHQTLEATSSFQRRGTLHTDHSNRYFCPWVGDLDVRLTGILDAVLLPAPRGTVFWMGRGRAHGPKSCSLS